MNLLSRTLCMIGVAMIATPVAEICRLSGLGDAYIYSILAGVFLISFSLPTKRHR